MSLLDKMVDVIKESRKTIKEPIFLKAFSDENKQLNDLIELSKKVTIDKKKNIDRDIVKIINRA